EPEHQGEPQADEERPVHLRVWRWADRPFARPRHHAATRLHASRVAHGYGLDVSRVSDPSSYGPSNTRSPFRKTLNGWPARTVIVGGTSSPRRRISTATLESSWPRAPAATCPADGVACTLACWGWLNWAPAPMADSITASPKTRCHCAS